MNDLTARDLTRIKRQHERIDGIDEESGDNLRGDPCCKGDADDRPCDTMRLVAAVQGLARAVVAHRRGRIFNPLLSGSYRGDWGCVFCETVWEGGERHADGGLVERHAEGCIVLLALALAGEPDAG